MNATKLLDLSQDIAAEAACTGSMIISQGGITPRIIEIVKGDDFYDILAKELFAIILNLWQDNIPSDAVAIRSRFNKNNGDLFDYMCKCMDSTPSDISGPYYAQCVRDKSVERQLICMVDNMRNEIIDSRIPLKEKFISVGKLLHAEEMLQKNEDVSMANLVDDYYLRSSSSKGLPTGFANVDRHITLKRGRFNIIGGPPGMGKSSFLLDIFIHHLRLGIKPYLVSLEMYPDEIVERMIRNIARVESGFDKQNKEVMEVMGLISTWDGSICQKRDTNISEICNNILAKKHKDNIGIAYIDHLHLINGPGKSRYEQMTFISNALKSLAMRAEIPLVVAAQLNRVPQQRTNKRPRMSDLRDSGSLEQDADVIMLLYSEDYYRRQEQAEPEIDGQAECIIDKNRNGTTGTAPLIWMPQFSTFCDQTPSYVSKSMYESNPEPF